MESFHAFEIMLIAHLQANLPGLTPLMTGLSFLGSEQFFILIMPAIYWCVDSALGSRVGILLLLSGHFNFVLKATFLSPRPYWLGEGVQGFASESSFGFPSGHAMNSTSIWGGIAFWMRRRWITVLCLLIVLAVSFSRIYLGVHFISDVVGGWLFAGLLLYAVIKLYIPVSTWLGKQPMAIAVWALLTSTALLILVGLVPFWIAREWQLPVNWVVNANSSTGGQIDPMDPSGMFTTAGMWMGFLAGLLWMSKKSIQWITQTNVWKLLLRLLIGVIGVIILWYGLGSIFPRDANWVSYMLRFIRYALIGIWVSGFAPYIFIRLKLVYEKPDTT